MNSVQVSPFLPFRSTIELNSGVVGLHARRELLFRVFTTQRSKGGNGAQMPLATLVKKLQESLTRMESFEVVTVAQSTDGMFTKHPSTHLVDRAIDSKRSSPSLLARQLRLRLVATEDADVPKSLSNIVVSIHAIATFQALHDYLRPRVAGILPSGSRLSGMLAALAASALAPPSSSRGLPTPSAPNPTSTESGSLSRRRSLRLKEKRVGAVDTPAEPSAANDEALSKSPPQSSAGAEAGDSSASPSAADSASSGTAVQEPEYTGDCTDEEIDVDAEVRCIFAVVSISLTAPRYSRTTSIWTTWTPTRQSLCLLVKVGIYKCHTHSQC